METTERLTEENPYGKNIFTLTIEYKRKIATESLLGETTRRRFLSVRKALIPITGENRSDQRMPSKPYHGFDFPFRLSGDVKTGSDACAKVFAVAWVATW